MQNIDSESKFKLLHNFKDSFVKMKVKSAAAQLSHTVAAAINVYSMSHPDRLLAESVHTAEFVEKIDCLLDFLNGYSLFPDHGKEYRCVLQDGSPHLEILLLLTANRLDAQLEALPKRK
jgi:gamma-glutamyl phosphate reductase